MARNVVFDIIAHDRASKDFVKAAGSAELLHNRLERLNRGFPPILAAAAALGPALIPALATAGAAAVGMGAALTGAGSAVGVFGAVTKSAFGEVKAASDSTGKLRDKMRLLQQEAKIAPNTALHDKYVKALATATREYDARLALLPPTTRNVVRAYDSMTSSWQGFVDKNKPAVYGVMTAGFGAIARHVGDLQPLFDTGARFATRWVHSITGWLDDGGLKRVVAFLNGQAGPALDHLTGIFKNLATAGGNIAHSGLLTQNGGLLGFLEKGSASLAKWTGGDGLTRLMNYLDKNGPKVASVGGQIAQAVFQIAQAVTPLAPVSLALAGGLSAIIAATPPGVLTAIVGAWVGMSVALRLVGAGAKIAAAGQLLLNAAMDANPIGLVIIGIAALVGVFVLVKTHAKQVAQFFVNMWQTLVNAGKTAVSFVLGLFDKFLGGIGSILRVMGRLPGPLGAPFRAAAGAVDDARAKVQALQATINATHGKTVRMVVTQEGAQKVQREIDSITGHAVAIQVGLVRGVGVRGFASGTSAAPPGWAWVGEAGPELMRFRGGEQVIDAVTSQRVAPAVSPGVGVANTLNVTVNLSGVVGDKYAVNQWIRQGLRDTLRREGKVALANQL